MQKILVTAILTSMFLCSISSNVFAWDMKKEGEIVGVATHEWSDRTKILVKLTGSDSISHLKVAADNADMNKFLAMALTAMSLSHTATIFWDSSTGNIEDIHLIKN